MPSKSNFLDKVLGRLPRLDKEGLQTVVERLAHERAFLETLFNTIEDGVLVVDAQERIAYFNDAAIRLLGLPQAAEGQPIARFLPELDWEQVAAMDRAGGKRVARHEFEIHYPRPRFLHVYAAPLDAEKRGASGVALIVHDATEAREKTFAAIESERSQALTLLAASVAHEIGNPLNALSIHLQLLEREARKLKKLAPEVSDLARGAKRASSAGNDVAEVAAKVESYLGVAKGEIDRLDYIITQFLQAIRPAPLQIKPVSLNDVVRETLDLLRPEIENRGIRVDENLSSKLPLAPIDPAQMKQVLVNLSKNALQAMTRGGVLTLRTEARDDGVFLIVSDTGGGIPQDLLNRIFEPFYTTKKKGSGLGLMIVQRIVRDHGGRIQLESNVGQGTTFRIWLPLQERTPWLLGAASER
ncbi:MAG TPA: ATP-binding protein [Candidatus Limnocylindria bacterium]|nr:ATP-binding protein [Candidatus Limnocylindria bacterium]